MDQQLAKFDVTPEMYQIVATWDPPERAGMIIRQWREDKGWSASQLARFCKVQSHTTPAYWERGEKQPRGEARDILLSLLAPLAKNVASGDVDGFLNKMRSEYPDQAERRFREVDDQWEKNVVFLSLKCQGHVLPGVDIKALDLYFKIHADVQRDYRMSIAKGSERKLSTAAKKWLGGDVYEKAQDAPSNTTTSSESVPDNVAPSDKSNDINEG